MRRFLVPAVLTIGMSGLAITIIAIIIARSPYTHGNLASAAGYTRTKVAYIGEEYLFEGMPLANPQDAQTGDPVHDGRLLFFNYGCASCHSSNGSGGAVGKALTGASALKISTKVREGPKTMPAFSSSMLSDEELQKIIAFLQSQSK
jgi:mono/diheme cytochrome c family protein